MGTLLVRGDLEGAAGAGGALLEDEGDVAPGVPEDLPVPTFAAHFEGSLNFLTARVEAEYDQRITQRLILQPRFEVDLAASDIPELEIGSGVSSLEAGLRLRYEIRKEFAPYVGVEWNRAFGASRDFIEARGGDAEDTKFVVGLKAWF